MSDGSRQATGRRASDGAKFVDELTRTLASVEKANNLLRCHNQDLKAELKAMKEQLLDATNSLAHEQALRRKAEAAVEAQQPNFERTP